MAFSPEFEIAFTVSWTAIPIMLLFCTGYLRMCSPQRKLSTPASRIANFLLILQMIFPALVIIIGIFVACKSIKLRNDPTASQEMIHELWVLGFKFDILNQQVWIVTLWGIKGDFLCKYFDLRQGLPKSLQRVIIGTAILTFATFIASFGINLLFCLPFQRNWSLSFDRCSSQSSRLPVQTISILHLVTEIAVLLIPILIFSHIPLQRKDIKPFIFIFFLRVLTVSAGAAGYGFRIEAVLGDHTQVSTEGELYDFIQEDMARVQKVRFTSVAEAAIGLLVVSMPSLRVFLRRKGSKDVTVVVGITSNKGDIEASRISRGKYHSYVEMDAVLADHEVTKSTGQIVDPSSRSAGIK